MKAFLHHLAHDFRTGIRDRSKLMMFYLFPLVFFALVGSLMAAVNPGFNQTMLPAMVLFALMCATLLNLPSLLVGAREEGVFRSYRINGVPVASIIAIPVIGTAVHMTVVSLLISLAGPRLFGGIAPASPIGFAAAALLAYLAYAGIGVLIGVAAGNATVSILVGQLIYIPSIILGGLMVPASILPPALARLSQLLPASHAMRVFAGVSMPEGSGTPWLSLGVLAASALTSFLLAGLLFEWDSRARQPSRKAWAALLAIVPYAVAALV
ncbi:MAG: ABC transporter permease [Spirochaetes bacterium]|nr:ABC transporter permease [Spirochaetota bacterium]